MNSLEKYSWCFYTVLRRLFNIIFIDIVECKINNVWGYRCFIILLNIAFTCIYHAYTIRDKLSMPEAFIFGTAIALAQVRLNGNHLTAF